MDPPQQLLTDRIKERKLQDDETSTLWEKYPRCAILPSPEKLDKSIGSPGSDKTDTLRDFDLIKDWVTKSNLLNTEFYDWAGIDGDNIEHVVYYSFISTSFTLAFDAMRNTAKPELEELVFWYYAGHGLSEAAAQKLCFSSTPNLTELPDGYYADVNKFVMEGRKVKGGELCLHKVGFCDLYGLLKPWIAAVKAPSQNAEGSKKNKHLVIILDSCYSGIIAEELKVFEEIMKDSTFLEDNSVTIQAACGPNEGALGGYFTPCFVYLNDPEKADLLNELKTEWNGMTEVKKNEYKSLEFPSPMVVSTIPQDGNITMELNLQDFKFTLFQDPGFFKFCSVKVYQHQDKSLFHEKDRVLNRCSAEKFMGNGSFDLLDYKLKTYKGGPDDPNANTPMGMFLLKDHCNKAYTVCAHVHFDKFLMPQRINLVHHKKPPVGSAVYLHKEDHGGLTPYDLTKNLHKVPIPTQSKNAHDLLKACSDYVESKQPGRWKNVSQWNMNGNHLGVNGLFRVQEQERQRSAWEDSYLEHIKQFHIPEIALQFPDSLLIDSAAVASLIEKNTAKKVFVLADTSYGSCCVDEVAAEHVQADLIIHYGRACLSQTRRLPVLHIFGKWPISIPSCLEKFTKLFPDPAAKVLVFSDVVYNHCMGDVQNAMKCIYPNVIFTKLTYFAFEKEENFPVNHNVGNKQNIEEGNSQDITSETKLPSNSVGTDVDMASLEDSNKDPGNNGYFCRFGREFSIPADSQLEEYNVFYIGGESLCLRNLMMSYNKCQFSSYDPCTNVGRKETLNVNKTLMKRYYMIQRAKDAQVVGIVVGTLGVADYLKVIERMKQVIKIAGKKSYLFVMGKLNVAKMANFMEVDVFVLVACPENTLIDSKEFYKPIVTPFEMEIACLRTREWTGDYITDFRDLLPGSSTSVDLDVEESMDDSSDIPDVSLISGHLRPTYKSSEVEKGVSSSSLVERNQETTLSTQHHTSAAEYLASRSWKGLEQKQGETPVTKAVHGRAGLAAGYSHEKGLNQESQENLSSE